MNCLKEFLKRDRCSGSLEFIGMMVGPTFV